ncbi:MAG: PEP-CTERM sorting domain-containing protein [Phycisphaerae bacterium]
MSCRPGAFSTYTFTATATGASTLLDISGLNFAGGQSTLLDNVSVVAVPETAPLALLGVGAAGLLLVRRRKVSA